jgi:hypothetical protein
LFGRCVEGPQVRFIKMGSLGTQVKRVCLAGRLWRIHGERITVGCGEGIH